MRQLAFLLLPALLLSPARAEDFGGPAPTGSYIADIAHTSVHWRIDHFGLSNYTARFTDITAELAWNREDPARSSLVVRIDPLSVETDFPFPEKEDFDATIGEADHMLSGDPIEFRSTTIGLTGEQTGTVTGQLTFRGQTHPASFEVVLNGSMAEHPMDKVPKLGFSATAIVKRTDWGLDFALDALGEGVEVIVEAEFVPAPQS